MSVGVQWMFSCFLDFPWTLVISLGLRLSCVYPVVFIIFRCHSAQSNTNQYQPAPTWAFLPNSRHTAYEIRLPLTGQKFLRQPCARQTRDHVFVVWLLMGFSKQQFHETVLFREVVFFLWKWSCLLDYAERDCSNSNIYTVLSLFRTPPVHTKKSICWCSFQPESKFSVICLRW